MNFKQCDENVNEWFIHFNVCLLSIAFQDGVNDLNVSANERIFFFFLCRMTHKNA